MSYKGEWYKLDFTHKLLKENNPYSKFPEHSIKYFMKNNEHW